MDLIRRFQDFIKKENLFSSKDRLLLAVSGGMDSSVLCELCHQAGFDFVIAHCNFQLRGDFSDGDEKFARSLAEHYKVPFVSKGFDTTTIAAEQKTTIEETARNLRYDWFHELLDPAKTSLPKDQIPRFIVTGHHADDNLETVMMNFYRGTGIKGLRGILPKRGKIVRPLLFARRKDIEDFVAQHQLKFRTDASNQEDTFTRNFFRNQVIPLVQKTFPATEQNILNNIDRMAEVEQLYLQAIDRHKEKLLEKKGNEVHIPVLKLKKSSPLQTIVYEIIKDFGFTASQSAEVIELLDSESGKYVASSSHRIIRNRAWLIIAPLEAAQADNVLVEEDIRKLELGIGTIHFETQPNSKLQIPNSSSVACLDTNEVKFPLLLRKWKPGDYFYPLGMKKKKKLARFLIDLKLSKTQKENVWVIESNKKICWVVGYRIDDRFKLTDKTGKVLTITITDQK